MRVRKKSLKHGLTPREAEICARLAKAREFLGINRQEAARKIQIPQSTLSNFELCVVPLRAEMALRICRKLILSEEWLATGKFEATQRAAVRNGIPSSEGLEPIYRRQCMDLLASREATQLPGRMLFSEAFDRHLSPVFEGRIQKNFYTPGIPATTWQDTDPELGRDLLLVLVERFQWILSNEALRRNTSPQHAGTVYLGFLIRMAMFGYKKCMGQPIRAESVGLPFELFRDADLPIVSFETEEELRRASDFAPLAKPSRKGAIVPEESER